MIQLHHICVMFEGQGHRLQLTVTGRKLLIKWSGELEYRGLPRLLIRDHSISMVFGKLTDFRCFPLDAILSNMPMCATPSLSLT